MSGRTIDVPRSWWPGWLARTAGLLFFWVILSGVDPVTFLVGVLAAGIATAVSLRLLSAGRWRIRPFVLARLVLHFFRQSIVAGIDVAWRALDPRLPLRPGFVIHRTQLPPGPVRNAFCTMTSLLPGTLPCGSDRNHLIIHCLDITQPVTEQLAKEEVLLVQALGWTRRND